MGSFILAWSIGVHEEEVSGETSGLQPGIEWQRENWKIRAIRIGGKR